MDNQTTEFGYQVPSRERDSISPALIGALQDLVDTFGENVVACAAIALADGSAMSRILAGPDGFVLGRIGPGHRFVSDSPIYETATDADYVRGEDRASVIGITIVAL